MIYCSLKRIITCTVGGIGLLLFMGSANAGSLVCVGEGNEWQDFSCNPDAAILGGDASGVIDADEEFHLVGKEDEDGNEGAYTLIVGGTDPYGSPATDGGSFTFDEDPDPVFEYFAVKANGWYAVFENDESDPGPYTWEISVAEIEEDLPSDNPGAIFCTSPPDKCNADLSHVAAYSTSPVPLPAAAWLFGSALLGLADIGRFSRRRRA